MYYHGESINVNVQATNNSNKTVKKIKISGDSIEKIKYLFWQKFLIILYLSYSNSRNNVILYYSI